MDPTAAPTYDQAVAGISNTNNAPAALATNVSQLAPLATTYHSTPTPAPYANYVAPKSASTNTSGSFLPEFWGKVTSIAQETGNIAKGAASWVTTVAKDAAMAPINFGASIANGQLDRSSVDSLSAQSQYLNTVETNIIGQYKSGQLSKVDYLKALGQLGQDLNNVSNQLSSYESKTNIDQQNATKSAIGVASDVVTIMTAGLGSPELIAGNQVAATTLSGAAELAQGAATIEKLAASSADWASVSPLAQDVMRQATTEVLQAAGKQATAGALSRAVATDVLLKYPLTYNAMSGTGMQVYNELNQNKYGDAVKTIAFNATLLFMGGPIGWGLRQGGKLADSAAVAFGLKPGSILDELSSRIGNGDRLALGKIAQEQIKAGNEKDVKAMIVGLESNLKAAGGNAPMAINKITDHLENYIGWGSMKNMDHQQAWDNIVNYWKHAEGLQGLKAAGKIEGMAADDSRTVVPGRFSTQDKNGIAEAVTKGDLALSSFTQNAVNDDYQPTAREVSGWKAMSSTTPPEVSASDRQLLRSAYSKAQAAGKDVSQLNGRQLADIYNPSTAEASLPKGLSGAKPNYSYGSNRFSLNFKSDTAKALYIVAQTNPSAHDGEYIAFLKTVLPGKSEAEIRAMGADVKASIKAEARNSTNSSIDVHLPPQVSGDANKAAEASKIATLHDQQIASTKDMTDAQARQELIANHQQDMSANNAPPVSNPTAPQTIQDRLNAFDAHVAANPNSAFANNPNVYKQVTNLIKTIEDPQALHTAINKIDTQIGLDGIPKDYAAKMAKDGYIAIVPTHHNLPVIPFSETSGKLVTNAAEGNFFVKAASPVPVLQSVGNLLVNMGLSPVAAEQRVQDIFTSKFTEAASQFGFLHTGAVNGEVTAKDTLASLYDYMKSPTGGMRVFGHYLPITDMRQLSVNDIMRALSVSKSEAQTVGDAIMQAYLDVPRAVTGLGNKVLDVNFKVNPLAAPFSRVQGAGRFSWNPVFTQARLPLKAEFLAQMQTGGKFPTIAGTNRFMSMFFPGQYKELNTIIDNPDFRQLIGGGLGGEADTAATGMANVAKSELPPRTTLLPVAGLVQSMAKNAGLDVATFIQQFPTEVQDATTALLHYDRNNSFLNSPLAKTLNVAFFPFRFNVKVTTFMAKAIASQPPAVQYAVIKGVMDAQTFLKSPQGQAWYSQNSDAIGLFKYFSPLETLSTYASILSHPGAISSYGELGGLPFGWIPQATDAAGLTHFGQAYVNPKTGAIAKDYVPTSAYGALNAAIQDLLGALFTYPGATAGLPTKGSAERWVAGNILPYSSKDFKAVDNPNVSAQDQQFSQIAASGSASAPSTAAPPTPASTPAVKVPALSSPKPTPLPKATRTPKLKKADYKPALLPGQTQLGQL